MYVTEENKASYEIKTMTELSTVECDYNECGYDENVLITNKFKFPEFCPMFYMQKITAITNAAIMKCVYTEPMIITQARKMCGYNEIESLHSWLLSACDTFAQRQVSQDLVSTM